jgi:glycosyltransferase involved in cell wall biosynthesis
MLGMTLLVKDEEDILEENLIFHKAMGVDKIIVTDNNSTDRTPEILQKYKDKGWIVEIINEPSNDYSQNAWVKRMIDRLINVHDVEWIINSDADEFWYPKSGCLKSTLFGSKYNVHLVRWRNMLPLNENEKFWDNTLACVKPIPYIDDLELSPYTLLDIFMPKIIHKAEGFIDVRQGNHNVEMKNKKATSNKDIILFHFSIRSFEHFKRKVVTGGAAYAKNTYFPEIIGGHWKYWYQRYLRGELREEFDLVIGAEHHNRLKEEGFLKEDKRIYRFFKNL